MNKQKSRGNVVFSKGSMFEGVEVKVMSARELPDNKDFFWERDLVKHIQSEIRLERFYEDSSQVV
jgi:hypothetical protein